jgi:hypothetical protein
MRTLTSGKLMPRGEHTSWRSQCWLLTARETLATILSLSISLLLQNIQGTDAAFLKGPKPSVQMLPAKTLRTPRQQLECYAILTPSS